MNRKEKILGVLGGMGTYAGLNFVKNLLESWQKEYKVKKEWDYPRFILDSNCKLPSRVRHILYNDKSPLEGMVKSVINLHDSGANLVIIPCNTAHYFINEIEKQTKVEIVNMIKILFKYLRKRGIKKINVLASEGTMSANLYSGYDKEIEIKYSEDEKLLRAVIDDVKKNCVTSQTIINFKKNLNKNSWNILGCTEFSLLYSENTGSFKGYKIIDTENITISYLTKYLKK